MNLRKGFTLVELLVVIAIITILAATVVPRVTNWIARARMARAVSEIKGTELALTKMLSDTDKNNFGQFFKWTANPTMNPPAWVQPPKGILSAMNSIGNVYSVYNQIFYELLRIGRDADLNSIIPGLALADEVKRKLGTNYMDLSIDPWGNSYQFYAGPMKRDKNVLNYTDDIRWRVMPWRSYRGLDMAMPNDYMYNADALIAENLKIRGNPPADNLFGFPAPYDLPVYIWSMGANGASDQQYVDTVVPHERLDGGDDINNWDSQSGWGGFY